MPETMHHYVFRQLRIPLAARGCEARVLAQELRVTLRELQGVQIERLALDSRRRSQPSYSCNIRFSCARKLRHPLVSTAPDLERMEDIPGYNSLHLPRLVQVVGAGPAGIWAALSLAERGYKVELHEQGRPVEERFLDIRRFFHGRQFIPHSNVLFGEGGAGAFSDGKLTTRNRGALVRQVLDDFVGAGAPEEIRYLAKPHLGTDRMQFYLRSLRGRLREAGGEIHFGSCLEDVQIRQGKLVRVRFSGQWRECSALVLATGHSARAVYAMLHAAGVPLQSKPFAMGVRVEHPQSLINSRQLGHGEAGICGAAEYSLSASQGQEVRGAYSFCMCPGGVLIPCASEPNGLATNGMSYSRRSAPFANSGIIVPLESSEQNLWDGLNQQRALEEIAFNLGGSNFSAPAQTIEAFLEGRQDNILPKSSYPCGLKATDHNQWLPKFMSQSLHQAFIDFDCKIPGFIARGLMVSPETRTSSPLRIVRNENTMESVGVEGVYPIGEGAGYAGGIVTSAADGLRLGVLARKQERGKTL